MSENYNKSLKKLRLAESEACHEVQHLINDLKKTLVGALKIALTQTESQMALSEKEGSFEPQKSIRLEALDHIRKTEIWVKDAVTRVLERQEEIFSGAARADLMRIAYRTQELWFEQEIDIEKSLQVALAAMRDVSSVIGIIDSGSIGNADPEMN